MHSCAQEVRRRERVWILLCVALKIGLCVCLPTGCHEVKCLRKGRGKGVWVGGWRVQRCHSAYRKYEWLVECVVSAKT